MKKLKCIAPSVGLVLFVTVIALVVPGHGNVSAAPDRDVRVINMAAADGELYIGSR